MPCPDCSDNADYERVELVWPGKGKPVERVSLPFQTIERVNDVRRSRSAQAELVGAVTPAHPVDSRLRGNDGESAGNDGDNTRPSRAREKLAVTSRERAQAIRT